ENLFKLFGALTDVILMPLMPGLIKVLMGLMNVVNIVREFLDDPVGWIKDNVVNPAIAQWQDFVHAIPTIREMIEWFIYPFKKVQWLEALKRMVGLGAIDTSTVSEGEAFSYLVEGGKLTENEVLDVTFGEEDGFVKESLLTNRI